MSAPEHGARRLLAAPGLLLKRWADEETGVVFSPTLVRTHLVSAEAIDLLQACAATAGGLPILNDDWDAELIGGLVDAGLLKRPA